MRRFDPITLEIINKTLISTALEMGVTLERTAYSTIVREQRDCSCALFDVKGRLVAQAEFIPMHLGSMEFPLQEIIKRYGDEMEEGDGFLVSDPYSGAQHTPDIMIFSPIFYRHEMVAFAGNVAHHLDVGGKVPGSVGGDSTDIYQEGLRFAPVKFFSRGKQDKNVTTIIEKNVRNPRAVLGDLRAQTAANKTGEKRFLSTIERYGKGELLRYMAQLMDHSEKRTRAEISKIPSGKYESEDYLDNDGIVDEPIKVRASVDIKGENLVVDFTGSDPQVRGPVNSVITATKSAVYYSIRCLLDPTIPQNNGCYRPISVIAPEGSVVNPKPPAACGGRTQVCYRIVDVVLGALSIVIPERVVAGSYGNAVVALGGPDPRTSERFVFFEVIPGGHGSRYNKDGIDATDKHLSNCLNTPIESIETEYPILVERYELIQDSGGPGRFRGGMGLRRDLRILAPEVTASLRSDKHKQGPCGLLGGKPGRPGSFIINPATKSERLLSSKTSLQIKQGDVISINTPGGGGYGDPKRRSIDLIKRDIAEGKLSARQAKETYGSALDTQ